MQFIINSPIGQLSLKENEHKITNLALAIQPAEVCETSHPWLDAYFRGNFNIPLPPIELTGSDFDLAVWQAVQAILPGTVKTYGDIAKSIGKPMAARAVGGALNRNPIMLIVPCHRVVSATGLGGFAWGLKIKQQLLQHESTYVDKQKAAC